MKQTLPAPGRAEPPSADRVLAIVRMAVFATSLFVRATDPLVPKIAADFAMDAATVALLSTGFALPYAVVQPVLGALADMIGKTRLMTISLAMVTAAAFVGALAPNFPVLLGSRVLAGVVAGGSFPISLAIAGDLVPVHQRQVAIGRLLAASMLGNLLGSPCAGLIGDLFGWRSVFVVIGLFASAALVAAAIGFRGVTTGAQPAGDLRAIAAGYRTILRNPLAKICFGAVLLEGIALFGVFPYVASLLLPPGETRAAIAGLVLAGFGLGGVVYSFTVPMLLRQFGEPWMMRAGGFLMGVGLLLACARLPWPLAFASFALMGFAFYSLHGVIQIYVTELAPSARGSATALHSSFFFFGQAMGPVAWRYGLAAAPLPMVATVSAVVLTLIGLVCAAWLRRPKRASGRLPS